MTTKELFVIITLYGRLLTDIDVVDTQEAATDRVKHHCEKMGLNYELNDEENGGYYWSDAVDNINPDNYGEPHYEVFLRTPDYISCAVGTF